MIHTPLTEVLREAEFTPENFYLHPADAHIADYIPLWHVLEGHRIEEHRVTEVNNHRVDGVLR